MPEQHGRYGRGAGKTLADLPIFGGREPTTYKRKGARKRNDVFDVWIRTFGSLCPDCGQQMRNFRDDLGARALRPEQITIDHIVGRSSATAEEAHLLTNQRCICRGCNNLKGKYEDPIQRRILSNPSARLVSRR
jgi:5-methylcytosine-specific restriction endonuclease McrA